MSRKPYSRLRSIQKWSPEKGTQNRTELRVLIRTWNLNNCRLYPYRDNLNFLRIFFVYLPPLSSLTFFFFIYSKNICQSILSIPSRRKSLLSPQNSLVENKYQFRKKFGKFGTKITNLLRSNYQNKFKLKIIFRINVYT